MRPLRRCGLPSSVTGYRPGEFSPVSPEAVYDLIVFSYQGVRMYSRLMEIEETIPKHITSQIKSLLLKEREKK